MPLISVIYCIGCTDREPVCLTAVALSHYPMPYPVHKQEDIVGIGAGDSSRHISRDALSHWSRWYYKGAGIVSGEGYIVQQEALTIYTD
jgi:hypothetical protein